VTLHEARDAATQDARDARARTLAQPGFELEPPTGKEGIVVDGLLGTGSTGAPRGEIADAVRQILRARAAGAIVAALDLPTGLDATTGVAENAVHAHLTLSFGGVKRGHLLNRDVCGTIVVLDIGLSPAADAHPRLLLGSEVLSHVPTFPADVHKGDRRRIAIVGGAVGMAGAALLAARGALRSGAGLVRIIAARENMSAVHSAVPQALVAQWPETAEQADELVTDWAHALVIGPGLGAGERSRAVMQLLLTRFPGPCVLDADALNILAAMPGTRDMLARRTCVLTPHAGEMARLMHDTPAAVMARRFDVASELSRVTGAAVLHKGVPTITAAPDGRVAVNAGGSPVLATGGSGDVLSGILGVLLAQTGDPFFSAAAAAYVHGRAGELAAEAVSVRGATLDDVLTALGGVWREEFPPMRAPVIAELPLPSQK
jgi:NAD(P)H-hydrate epimerase